MLLDYLRFAVRAGNLRHIAEDAGSYANGRRVTGLHVRFVDEEVKRVHWDLRYRPFGEWGAGLPPLLLEELFGLRRLGRAAGDKDGAPINEYEETRHVEVEAIVDIDPESWSEELREPRPMEFGRIVFRRAAAAQAHLSPDSLYDVERGPGRDGTLTGFFRSRAQPMEDFALTCGHVAGPGAKVAIGRRRSPFWVARPGPVAGRVWHSSSPAPYTASPQPWQPDAALIQVGRAVRRWTDAAAGVEARPVAALIQEEPVHFWSPRRKAMIRARISGVTVWKAMDLHREGRLLDVGDVLMLGSAHYRYFASTLSQPGDSGAAVRGASAAPGGPADWYGMILGSDQESAYANYAELLWGWAANRLSDPDLAFCYAS
jgi:hypothetical protein